MPKKKKSNNYFDEEVEAAILKFNESTDDFERNRLFRKIYPALCKIAQVWRNKIKPTYVNMPQDELEMDCVSFLLEKLPMIKEGKGKAFSYLTVTARNFYILANQNAYKKRLKGYSLESMSDNFDIEEIPSNRVEQMEWNGLLFDTFIEYVDENFDDMFSGFQQKQFATSLFSKIKTYGFTEGFNRRKVLNDVAQETGISRGLVTKQVNRLAAFYTNFKEYFETYGVKPKFKEKYFVSDEDAEYIRKNYQHYSKHNGLMGISRRLGINYDSLRKWVKQSDI